MAPPPHEDSRSTQDGALRQELKAFVSSLRAYLFARSELFAIEASEAASEVAARAFRKTLSFLFCFIGYVLFLTGLVGVIGQLLADSQKLEFRNWIGACLILALVHFVIGVLLRLSSSSSLAKQHHLFEHTRAEFRKDQEWLADENQN